MLLYGAGPKKLATQLGISIAEAKELMNKYFRTFPKIKRLMDQLVYNCKKTHLAVSPLDGRYIDLRQIDWNDDMRVAHALNQAKNCPFQACSASISKLALCYINRRIKKEQIKNFRFVDIVHDIGKRRV